jgi:hypothetical protein
MTAFAAGMELAQAVAEPSGKWECLHNPAGCILPVAVPVVAVVEGPFGLADSHHRKCVVLGVGSQTVRGHKQERRSCPSQQQQRQQQQQVRPVENMNEGPMGGAGTLAM